MAVLEIGLNYSAIPPPNKACNQLVGFVPTYKCFLASGFFLLSEFCLVPHLALNGTPFAPKFVVFNAHGQPE